MPKIISSVHNKFIKNLVLHLKKKKKINHSELCLIEGEKIINEAIRSNLKFYHIFLLYDPQKAKVLCNSNFVEKILQHNLTNELFYVTEEVMQKMTFLDTAASCAAVVEIPHRIVDITQILKDESTLLIVDGLQDAGNLGTIIRTCEAFGVKSVFVTRNCVSPYNLKVIRGSMGSIFRVKIIKDIDFLDIYSDLKKYKFSILSSSPRGKDIRDVEIQNYSKVALVVGSEGKGISQSILEKSDIILSIPMEKKVNSLNVAIATGILLYYRFISKVGS